MMTNSRIGSVTILVVLALTLGLWLPRQSASAQSPNSCQRARGRWFDSLNSAGGTTGTITQGGFLNGTTDTVYNPAFVFTPDPTAVSYIAESTITTNHGLLKTVEDQQRIRLQLRDGTMDRHGTHRCRHEHREIRRSNWCLVLQW